MAINAQFPDWLRQDTRDAQAAGIAIGRNMLEGLKLREEKRQFDQTQPLRQAQSMVAQEQYKGLVNHNNLAAIEAKRKARETGYMADALALEEDIAGSENGFSNPENQARFYSFLKDRIDLLPSTWAASMEEKFKNAETMSLKTQELQARLAQLETVNQFREDSAIRSAEQLRLSQEAGKRSETHAAEVTAQLEEKDKNDKILKMTPEERQTELGWSPEKSRAFDESQAYGGKMRIARNYVDDTAKSLAPLGIEVNEQERALLAAQYLASPSSLQAPQDIVKSVNSEGSGYNRLDKVIQRIDKLPAGVFDKAVGPFDSKKFEWTMRLTPQGLTTDQQKELRSIIKEANFIVQGYRNKQFGSQLTEGETRQFFNIVGDPSTADYSEGLKSFRTSIKNSLMENLQSYKLAPNIPIRYKQMFLAGQQPESLTPNGTPSNGGNVIQFDVQPDGSVKRR